MLSISRGISSPYSRRPGSATRNVPQRSWARAWLNHSSFARVSLSHVHDPVRALRSRHIIPNHVSYLQRVCEWLWCRCPPWLPRLPLTCWQRRPSQRCSITQRWSQRGQRYDGCCAEWPRRCSFGRLWGCGFARAGEEQQRRRSGP